MAHPAQSAERELVLRIMGSRSFARSERLATLLNYVCDMTFKGRESDLNEQKIGQAVFSRPPDYDSSADGIVRTQASRLRQRLELYFEEEGVGEPIRLIIPKGAMFLFSGTSSVANSNLYYTNGNLGIGKTPAAALDVSGISFFGGQVVVEKGDTATGGQSANSHSLLFQTSGYNSSSKAAVSPYIEFLGEVSGNNTASPTASLHLLTGTGTGAATESGFYLNSNGTIHFASAQTFPIAAGPQGPAGPAGPSGPKGSTGPTGPAGPAGGLTLPFVGSTTTGNSSSYAFVVESKGSDSGNAILALGATSADGEYQYGGSGLFAVGGASSGTGNVGSTAGAGIQGFGGDGSQNQAGGSGATLLGGSRGGTVRLLWEGPMEDWVW